MSFKENCEKIQDVIKTTCDRVKRDSRDIKLIAVSKTFPVQSIREAFSEGQIDFGENKVQEAELKKTELTDMKLNLHLIGNLQSNKVNKAVQIFDFIQSVDSLKIAKKIDISCRQLEGNKIMPIYLQINTSLEPQKSGIIHDIALIEELVAEIKECPNIHLKGLMTIGPLSIDESETRKAFSSLFSLKEKLNQGGKNLIQDLSMGMSHDFVWAIEEGSNILRIGSSLFGAR